MKRRSFLKTTGLTGLVTVITPTGIVQAFSQKKASALEDSFINPPASAKPQTWWHWMNGNVTKEGITLDLEAMQRVGVGGFQNFDAGTLIPKGPITYLSPEWIELKKHTIKEAERLGLEFTMHNCPGWSSSGGPWITPELAMQQVSWSESFIAGGKQTNIELPQPFTKLNYYRDECVLAFPSLPGEMPLQNLLSKATAGTTNIDFKNLADDPDGVVVQAGGTNQPAYLQLHFNNAYEASSIAFIAAPVAALAPAGPGGFGGNSITLESSDDGVAFTKVTSINVGGGFGAVPGPAFVTAEFPAIKAKHFRLASSQPRQYSQLRFSGADKITNWKSKANYTGGFWQTEPVKETNKEASKTSVINPDTVLDISQYMNKDGKLDWNAPAGNWTILRVGNTPIGTMNRSAPDTGIGLECDKFSAAAIDFHFNEMMQNLLPALGPIAAKGKVGLLIDSWEVGMQNWTAQFSAEFQKRNGYDLKKYLPAMTGRIVGSAELSDRFLWDVRRTQADLLADNYYGRFAELCRKNKIIAYTEPYDRGPMEEMQVGAKVDVNMGEFWNGLSSIFQNNITMRRTTKLAASIVHINGQKIVGAEAFTSEPASSKWQEYPFLMKPLGDRMYTQGLNRVIFHRYAHQPHPTALPGMTMGPWGIHFDRTNTWWNPGRAWMKYMGRCQSLLQQGLFVADLLYFTGEDVAVYTKTNADELTPAPPEGYDYDLINPETVIKRLKVQNGRAVLPDGMSYKVFVFQNHESVSLEVIKKLRDLVYQGMVLVGLRPLKTPGLGGYTNNDTEFKRVVSELWDGTEGTGASGKTVGLGRVFSTTSLKPVLDAINLQADFEVSSLSGDAPVKYIHRRISNTEVYFIANQRRTAEQLVCTFRMQGKQPELWDPNTGKITPVSIFEISDGRTKVPLQLEPCGSMFIVFRTPATSNHIHEIIKDSQPVLTTKAFPIVEQKLHKGVTNNFTISVWVKPEMDVMLGARDFSGNVAANAWTDYYAIYPPSGEELYGKGHQTCGMTAGRNGVVIWTRGAGKPILTLAAPVKISGWSHVAVSYKDGVPAVYVNGKLVQQGKKAEVVMHPGIGKAHLRDGASYYNGDMTEPELFTEALTDDRILQLSQNKILPEAYKAPVVEQMVNGKNSIIIWENGNYSFKNKSGNTTPFRVAGIDKPIALSGSWKVAFPENMGAPKEIMLTELISLHLHSEDGVKYFSGTCSYTKSFNLPANATPVNKRTFLDLGRVEVIAEVMVNGKNLGILWKRPYQVDITESLKTGVNQLIIKVTNLWPNRLIGDEMVPEMYKFPAPSNDTSPFAALSNGGITELPEWYKQGQPKPADGRVTFTTWKHYRKDSPLLESGLIGPVILKFGVEKFV
ncbi:glycosyl hydrolase [Segetibacter aerophilus]|uniref:Beta-mannosidase-like galactose-binding domain-containing protein n=1 Tax=Segetibacter aerophilus TaxID=670293 RepID=A0A512BJZ0_9BACT|nr:glycosyl hydrolase [Segetibacter aerophilus]GEO12291.1 hypothetical protein SAE01_47870 [Segetibacter aerophilus]